MRVIAIKTLRDFWGKSAYREVEPSLRAWYAEAKRAHWKNPEEIKEEYRSASVVGNNRIVFNIKGNKYRLVVAIRYEFSLVFIRFIGTHAQYDKIDARRI